MIYRRAAKAGLPIVDVDAEGQPVTGQPDSLADLELALALALADAIALDASVNPVPGELLRAVIRWTEIDDPAAITVHLLGSGDDPRGAGGDDPSRPLEWANVDRELARADHVRANPEVALLTDTLAMRYRAADGQLGRGAERPIAQAVRLLEDALAERGVEMAPTFAASAFRAAP